MKLSEYVTYDALGLSDLIKKGEITSEEVAGLALEGVNKVNDQLNAIVSLFDQPYKEKAKGDAQFDGVPFFIKDIGASIAGIPQESGSRYTEGFVSPFTSYFAQNVLDSGFQVLGRSTCPEFGLTLTTESIAQGITRNPWNIEKIAGGSSGGSAALVASGVVPLAHSNDGGGSTRIPASCCGNVGLKASRGRVSLGPIMNDITSPLINEGCNSKTVRDTAAFLDVVSKPAKGEGILNNFANESFLEIMEKSPKKYKIAVNFEDFSTGSMEPEIRSELERICESLRVLGHTVGEASPDLSSVDHINMFSILWYSMAYAGLKELAPFTNRVADSSSLEPVTLQMMKAGEKITYLEFNQAIASLNHLSRLFGDFFNDWDLMLTPTFYKKTPNVSGPITLNSDCSLDDWLDEAGKYIPTTPIANMTGIPAISVPCGIFSDNLPLGMQFFAPMGKENRLIDIARQLEESEPWKDRRPEIFVA